MSLQIFRGIAVQNEITVDDGSVLRHRMLGEDILSVNFTSPIYLDIQIGDYTYWLTKKYTIHSVPIAKKARSNEYNYSIVFRSPQYDYENALFLLDGNNDFFLNGTIDTFLALIRDNMNRASGGSSYGLGTFPTGTTFRNISFSQDNCLSALQKVCEEYGLEYEFSDTGFTVDVEEDIGDVTGLSFEFKDGLRDIERRTLPDTDLVTRLYPYGSDRNIIFGTYGHKRLRIAGVTKYLENNVGTFGVIERSVIFDDIYPRREATVTAIDAGDPTLFRDSSMEFDLNSQLSSTTAKVTFNTGLLSGYEFEVSSYNNTTKEFELVPVTDDQDRTLPSATFKPTVGDKYVIHDIVMPQTYIDAAEAELEVRATGYLTEFSLPNVAYAITPDPINFRQNGVILKVGDIIEVTDTDFGITINTKIIEVQQSLADPYKYVLTVGNNATISLIGRIQVGLNQTKDNIVKERVDRTAERLRIRNNINDLNTLVDSIFDPSGDYFDPDKIKPLSIETAALAVGAKPLAINFQNLEIERNYNSDVNMIRVSNATMVHFTIEAAAREWDLTGNIWVIPDSNLRYLYAVVNEANNLGEFKVDSVQRLIDHEANKYTFLVGVIHEVADGTRGMSMVYGQTFINGRFITTGRIKDVTGANYFDLDDGSFIIGDGNSSLDWNVTAADKLTLKGGLIQSESGVTFPAPVFRGAWVSGQYWRGDVVTYNGSTYIYTSTTSTVGTLPTNATYWSLYSQKGSDGAAGATGATGSPGSDGVDGVDSLGYIPSVGAAQVGGYTDLKFTLNTHVGGTPNTGEIRIQGTQLIKPDATVVNPSSSDNAIITAHGEGTSGRFFILWSDTLAHTRFPNNSGIISDNNFFAVYWNGSQYNLVTNTGIAATTVTFVSTDVFLAAVEALTTSGGLDSIVLYTSGSSGPGILYRGAFSAGGTYYNNAERRDVVLQGGVYYIFKGVDGSVQASFIAGNWQTFGAQFDSVATNTLLAENANIADWIINSGRITSQGSYSGSPNAQLDGANGKIIFNGEAIVLSATGSATAVKGTAVYDENGIQITRPAASGQPFSKVKIEVDHIYINTAKTKGGGDVYTGIRTGIEADVVVDADRILGSEYVAAVFGAVHNNAPDANEALSYGGYFEGLLFTGPVNAKIRRASGTINLTRNSQDYIIICTGSTVVVMPPDPVAGRAFLVKRTTSSVTINGNGIDIYHNGVEGLTLAILTNGMAFMVVYDGVYWQVMILDG